MNPLVDSRVGLFGPGIDAWALDPTIARQWWESTETILGQRFRADRPANLSLCAHSIPR